MHFLIFLWLFLDYPPTPNEDSEDEGEKKTTNANVHEAF